MIFQDSMPFFPGFKEDITQQKKDEERIKYLKEFNELIINTMSKGLLVEDKEGKIIFTNPALQELTGYTNEELVNKNWNELISKEESPEIIEKIQNKEFTETDSFETKITDKSGYSIPVHVTLSNIEQNSKFDGSIVTFTDLRQLKQKEEELAGCRENLSTMELAKGIASAESTHDAKIKINRIVREIDKCIALLNK